MLGKEELKDEARVLRKWSESFLSRSKSGDPVLVLPCIAMSPGKLNTEAFLIQFCTSKSGKENASPVPWMRIFI